ncbi:MAG TPA: hypothetical protein V6C65_08055 [Allocoleopsis sp.]
MAQHEWFSPQGFVDKTKSTAGSVADSNGSVSTPANYDNNSALDARLTAISATTYSQKNLDSMTRNDKIYALRLNDDASTL